MRAVIKDNLKEKAYRTIKDQIVRCELAPGSVIYESELSEMIGASRTPIREALSKLEEERLVEIYPKRGIFVTNISMKNANDIYGLRKVLEPYGASLSAGLIDPDNLVEFAEFWGDASIEYTPERHVQMDRDFHTLIVRSTGNSYLIEFVGRLYDQISRIRFLTLKTRSERYSEIQHEHLRIIGCLLRRDADGASSAMEDHLARAHATAVNTFQKATLV